MKKIPFIAVLIFLLFIFFNINNLNYQKHREIQASIVEHPENLPTKEAAEISSFWFKNLKADVYWLQTVQYIWWNALRSEYKKYLYSMIDLVTHLNPYFEHPYKIWMLLLPNSNLRYENFTEDELKRNELEAEKLWLKWIDNFCDHKKIELIDKEDNLINLWQEEKYLNPCRGYSIPFYLAYVYYEYINDALKSSKYYKIASANEDSVEWAKILAAIMQWKWWNREKWYFMFLNIAKYIETEDNVCSAFATELENLWALIFLQKTAPLNWKVVEAVENRRNEIFWEFDEENDEEILSDTECQNYVNKATRELNLAYIEEANNRFMEDHPSWLPAVDAKKLFEEWYLEFLPTDFQQYENYWIVYKYDREKKRFDYKMGEY